MSAMLPVDSICGVDGPSAATKSNIAPFVGVVVIEVVVRAPAAEGQHREVEQRVGHEAIQGRSSGRSEKSRGRRGRLDHGLMRSLVVKKVTMKSTKQSTAQMVMVTCQPCWRSAPCANF